MNQSNKPERMWEFCGSCNGRGYTTNGHYETTCLPCRGYGGRYLVGGKPMPLGWTPGSCMALLLLLNPPTDSWGAAVADVFSGLLPALLLFAALFVLLLVIYLLKGAAK